MKRLESSADFLPFLQVLEGNSNHSHLFSHNSEKPSVTIISPDKSMIHQDTGSASLIMTTDLIFQSRCTGSSFWGGYSPRTRKTTALLGTGPDRVHPQQKEEALPACVKRGETEPSPLPQKSEKGWVVGEGIEYGCKKARENERLQNLLGQELLRAPTASHSFL